MVESRVDPVTGRDSPHWVSWRLGAWLVSVRLATQDGVPIVVELGVRLAGVPENVAELEGGPPGGLSKTVLRQVALGAWVQTLRALESDDGKWLEADPPDGKRSFFQRLRPAAPRARAPLSPPFERAVRRRPRRQRGRSDRFFAKLGDQYDRHVVKCVKSGVKPTPIAHLAALYDVDRDDMRDYVREGRERGIIPQGQPGRVAGGLTDYGRAILAAGPPRPTPTKKKKGTPA